MTLPFRSQVKAALFALAQTAEFPDPINGSLTWVYSSQRLKLWNNIDRSQQPAMFLVQHREEYRREGVGLPARRWLCCGLWCYAPTGDDTVVGDQILDGMEQALEAVLAPPPGTTRNEQTLDGLLDPVGWVRVDKADNTFIRDPGDIDGQALLILPVRILLP